MKCTEFGHMMEPLRADEVDIAEIIRFETHLLTCADCRYLQKSLQLEANLLKQAIAAPPLPDLFVASIMDQLVQPIDYPKTVPQEVTPTRNTAATTASSNLRSAKRTHWKRWAGISVAALFVVGAVSMYVSPTFAAYVSSFVSRIGGELGLKRAAEQGYNTPVNLAVSDHDYTLRIKDIVADTTRLVISYTLEDAAGKPLPNQFLPLYGANKIYLTDKDGKILSANPEIHEQGPDYGDLTFSIFDWSDDVIVHFEVTEIGINEPKKVSLRLKVPVNLAKSREASNALSVQSRYESPQGIVFSFERVMYAPSATRFDIQTRYTDEAYEQEKQKARVLSGKEDSKVEKGKYHFVYRIVNQSGEVIARSEKDLADTQTKNRLIYFSPEDSAAEGEQPGTVRWITALVPAEKPEELTFILEGIEKEELAHFSIPFRLQELSKSPVSKTADETGDTYTIKGMKKGIDPQTKEVIWTIELEGNQKQWDFPDWNLTDSAGTRYEVTQDYRTTRVRPMPHGYFLSQKLIIKGMTTPPNELTLSLQTYKKFYTDVDWQVAIPPK